MPSVRPERGDAFWAALAGRPWRRVRWRRAHAPDAPPGDARCVAYDTPIHRAGTYYVRPAYTDGAAWLSQQAYEEMVRRTRGGRASRRSRPAPPDGACRPARVDATVRPLTAHDEPLLWRVLYHAVWVAPGAAPPAPDVVLRPDLARYVADWMGRPGDTGVVVEEGGAAVGAGWLRLWEPGDHGYGFVDPATPELSMALLPGHRGRGLGTALLRDLLDRADREHDAVSLSVSLSNPARRLYGRFGFVPVGEPAGGAVVMLRPAPR